MIGSLARISLDSLSKTVNYVLSNESAQVVASNMPAALGKHRRKLTSSFRRVARLNERVEQPLYHISIRCAPEDKKPSALKWSHLSKQFLELMDLDNNPFVATTHGNNHVHLLVSRVDDTGKCHDSSWDYHQTQKALRTIEKEEGYRKLSSSKVGKRRDTQGQVHRLRTQQEEYNNGLRDEPPEPSKRNQLQQAIDEGIECACSIAGIKAFLKSQNIHTRQTEQGWSFSLDEYNFAGYHLGSNYTLNAVGKKMVEKQQSSETQSPQPQSNSTRTMGDILSHAAIQAGQEFNQLGQQIRYGGNQEFDGTDLLGLSEDIIGNALVIGGSLGVAIAKIREQFDGQGEQLEAKATNARIEKAIRGLEEAGEKVDNLQERILTHLEESESNPITRRATSYLRGENANPLADGVELIDQKIQLLSEEIPGQGLDSQSLAIDRSLPFTEQLEKVEQALGIIEKHSQNLDDLINEAELAQKQQLQEKAEAKLDSAAATAAANYIQSRSSVYNLPINQPVATHTMGDMKMSPESDYLAITKKGESQTSFEAVRIGEEWLVTKDKLSPEEKKKLLNLPQTEKDYAIQANGRDLTSYFQRHFLQELQKDGGSINWVDKKDKEVNYSFQINQEGEQTKILGFKNNSEDKNAVFQVELDKDGVVKTSSCEIPTNHINGLLQEEHRLAQKQKKKQDKQLSLRSSLD